MKVKYLLFFILSVIFIEYGYAQQFSLQGSASQLDATTYRLTSATMNQAGMITNYYPVNLETDFTLSYQLNFGNRDTGGADGFAFLLSSICNPPLVDGGGLGVLNILPSIIVEFDTYNNDKEYDDNSLTAFDHSCIYKNGNLNTPGRIIDAPGTPVCLLRNLALNCINVEDGNWHNVEIIWDFVSSTQQILKVKFDGVIIETSTGNHLNDIFFGQKNVFWSITGATGDDYNNQDFKINASNNNISFNCGDIVALTAPALGSNYVWDNSPNSTNGNTATYTATKNTTITCNYTNFCGVSQSVSFNININNLTTPTFSLPTSICKGGSAPTLPTTSTNGITGTWLPSTVSNQTSGTYTFTPTAGQCATTFTQNIAVTTVSFGAFAAAVDIFNNNFSTSTAQAYDIVGNFDGQAYTGFNGQSFINRNFGSHVQKSNTLFIKGGEMRTWKNAGTNVCGGKIQYVVYPTGSRPSDPVFSSFDMNHASNCNSGSFTGGGACQTGDQKWNNFVQTIDLTNRCPGNYTLEVYWEIDGSCISASSCDMKNYINNSGNNFISTFTITSPALNAGTLKAGKTGCPGLNYNEGLNNTAASGGSGTYTYSWESTTDPACSTGWTTIAGATTDDFDPPALNQTTCFRRIVSDGCQTAVSNISTYTINPEIISQTIVPSVADGSTVCTGDNISATFSGGSGGIVGETQDVYEFSIDAGTTWSTYTSGTSISTSGLSGSNKVQIRTRRIPTTSNTFDGCNFGDWNIVKFDIVSQATSPTVTPLTPICENETAQWQISGVTGEIVTYKINSGTEQTITLDASGKATITTTGTPPKQTLTLTKITKGTCFLNLNIISEITVNATPLTTTINPN